MLPAPAALNYLGGRNPYDHRGESIGEYQNVYKNRRLDTAEMRQVTVPQVWKNRTGLPTFR